MARLVYNVQASNGMWLKKVSYSMEMFELTQNRAEAKKFKSFDSACIDVDFCTTVAVKNGMGLYFSIME